MSQDKPITATIPMIMESTIIMQIVILPDETASHLCRYMGIHHPSSLCRWPMRVRLLPHENVYELLKLGESLYIHSKDFTDLSSGPAAGTRPSEKPLPKREFQY